MLTETLAPGESGTTFLSGSEGLELLRQLTTVFKGLGDYSPLSMVYEALGGPAFLPFQPCLQSAPAPAPVPNIYGAAYLFQSPPSGKADC